jgi:hypothetical protein
MEEAEIIVPDERLELIGGELVPMSQKGIDHEIFKQALSDRWHRLPRGVCDVGVATELYVSEDTFLGPDVVIYLRAGGSPASRQRLRCSSWRSRIRRWNMISAARLSSMQGSACAKSDPVRNTRLSRVGPDRPAVRAR